MRMLSQAARRAARPAFHRVGVRSLSSQATNSKSSNGTKATAFAGLLLGLAGAGAGVVLLEPKKAAVKPNAVFERPLTKPEDPNNPPPRTDLPTIPLDEVAEHCDEDSLWYTFRGAVYDLTFFINGHPGGTPRLLMAGKYQSYSS